MCAVFRYFDGQTDDAALTRAVVASAQSLGCELRLHSEVGAIELREHRSRVSVEQGATTTSMTARVVVNATGPWVNDLLRRVMPAQRERPVE